MFKRVLVPLDGSRFGSRALRYAEEIAQRFSAEVILIQVVKPATPVATTTGVVPGMESPSAAELALRAALAEDKRNQTRARRFLSRKVRSIKSKGIKALYYVVVDEPAEAIMRFAQKNNVDLVAMTTHGKSGLKRAVMGSVADKVIRESGKPVLVIRPYIKNKK